MVKIINNTRIHYSDENGNEYTNDKKQKKLQIRLNNDGINQYIFNHLNDTQCKDYDIELTINDTKQFNNIAYQLSNVEINNPLELNVCSMKIDRKTRLNFEILNSKVKVQAFFSNGEGPGPFRNPNDDFSLWMSWLDDKDYECVINKLNDKTKKRFEEERAIATSTYKNLVKAVPNFDMLSDREKMDYIFGTITQHTKYSASQVRTDGNVDPITESWKCDTVETYKRKEGVCEGRSNLIRLIANNRYVRLNCFCTTGMLGNLSHRWNIFIDDDKNTYYYDSSFPSIKHISTDDSRIKNRKNIHNCREVEKFLTDKNQKISGR